MHTQPHGDSRHSRQIAARLGTLLGLEGKTTVVSGGASGIGRATASLFVELGAHVVILDKLTPDITSREGFASRITSYVLDVTDLDACKAIGAQIAAINGPIRTLVNAAGIVLPDSPSGPSQELSPLFHCNVLGTANLCESLAPHFEESGGTIVNIGSVVGTVGWLKRAAYCASKGAVEAMSRALALELAPRNIRVNIVAPGIVATPLMQRIVLAQPDPYRAYQERANLQVNHRMIWPEEVAQSILFLASDLSSGVIGATLDMSAGRLAGHIPTAPFRSELNAENDSEWLRFSSHVRPGEHTRLSEKT